MSDHSSGNPPASQGKENNKLNPAGGGDGKPARPVRHRQRMGDSSGGAVSSTWLVTFTDIMALMLTFFVLLYSMSNPEDNKWTELKQTLQKELNKFYGPKAQQGSKDVINIKRLEQDKALSLSYLEPLVRKQFEKEDGLEKIIIFRNAGRLILSLPQTVVFETGGTRLSEQGRQAMFTIANVLSRIRNAVEIIGHTDPEPIAGDTQMPYSNNWALSLGRAAEVAGVLKKEGYRGELKLKGVAEARYTELPETLSQDRRRQLARRVDIVIETFE